MPVFNVRGSAAFFQERKEKYNDIRANEIQIETARRTELGILAVLLALSI